MSLLALLITVKNNSQNIFETLDDGRKHYTAQNFEGPYLKDDMGKYDINIGEWKIIDAGPVKCVIRAKGSNILNNKKVDFINCEQLGKHVENLCQYVTKGKQILVEGELNIDNYEKDGEKRSFTKVKVDRLEFLSGNSNANTENKQNNEYKIEEFNDFDEDEIPF